MEFCTVAGEAVPAIGLGTARMTAGECERAVERALELGYRHIDTAQIYDTEAAVGLAVSTSDVDREDVFLTTKLHRTNLRRTDVFRSVDESLDRLETDYVDLLLIHEPNPGVPVEETIGAMNDLQAEGCVRHVGVSNFPVRGMQAATNASRSPIFTNQIEYSPARRAEDVVRWCLEHDVLVTAYSPLDVGRVLYDETLQEIGRRYGKSAAQVALRWLTQQDGVVAIPKAIRREHLAENLDVFDFELTDDEMLRIFDLTGGLAPETRTLLGL
jgi:diketogulonate reductase-like aldo/keto reductase